MKIKIRKMGEYERLSKLLEHFVYLSRVEMDRKWLDFASGKHLEQ